MEINSPEKELLSANGRFLDKSIEEKELEHIVKVAKAYSSRHSGITELFRKARCFADYCDLLEITRMRRNESLEKFYMRLIDIVHEASVYKFWEEDISVLRDRALRSFILALPMEWKIGVAATNPKTLEDAYNVATNISIYVDVPTGCYSNDDQLQQCETSQKEASETCSKD